MLRVGENTGALDTALMNMNYFYKRDVKESVDKALEDAGAGADAGAGRVARFRRLGRAVAGV